jgi:diguanylate cyclase (GGDEF)-like protein
VSGTSPLSLIASLRGALEAAHAVRTREDLTAALATIATATAETLGCGTVVINLHRPAFDDFEATAVHGTDDARAALLGTASSWEQWAPYLAARFERRGTHHVPAGTVDGQDDDVLVATMRRANGDVLGLIAIDATDGPRSPHGADTAQGPSDDDLDRLVAVTQLAALAVERLADTERDARRRDILDRLLTASSRNADHAPRSSVLDAVCCGIREALGFQRVAVLASENGGLLRPAGTAGWTLHDPVFAHLSLTPRELEPLLQPIYGRHGCYLLEREDAEAALGLETTVYRSQSNGHGPYAWSRHWLLVPLRDADGEVRGIVWVDDPADRLLPGREEFQALRLFADQAVTALEADEGRDAYAPGGLPRADHDPLTGLANRAKLAERLRHALQRVKRADTSVAVLFIDLDNFQHANESLGHAAGDELLRISAARIDEDLRPGDTVARFGGDEFVALCEDVGSPQEAMDVAERLRVLLSEPIPLATGVAQVTASIGVALPDRPDRSAEALLQAADRAMYEAKAAGRDAARLATPGAGWP